MPRRKTLKLSTPADIRRVISRIANMALNGEIDPKRANTLLYACNAALAAIRTDEYDKKLAELEMTALQRARQAARKALESTYEGRATVVEYQKIKDEYGLTSFQEVTVLEDQPCKLSFETLTSNSGDPVATIS